MDANLLEKKIRLLILSQLGFSRIGQNLTYIEISSALQIEEAEVEKWAIDGMYKLRFELWLPLSPRFQ